MPDFQVTQKKINALLEELRGWEPTESRYTLNELARMFELDSFIIDRIARSEGFLIRPGDAFGIDDVDPNAETLELDPGDVRKALEETDPEDVDTAVYRRTTSGRWERVEEDE